MREKRKEKVEGKRGVDRRSEKRESKVEGEEGWVVDRRSEKREEKVWWVGRSEENKTGKKKTRRMGKNQVTSN